MRTPAGQECPHYYEDFNRGRSVQECRLVNANPDSLSWRPQDCAQCPVPEILLANASRNMQLKLTIKLVWLGLKRKMDVTAWCLLHEIPIKNPYVGCPLDSEENDGLKLFREALEHSDLLPDDADDDGQV
ncbi:MAG: hypothetical protein JXA10_13700 [Anaerolineae bacterium]|nr:hypothetical protein [Anaerolineae bacterium]